jgi:transposase-like protein
MEDMISTPNPTPDSEVLARPRRRSFTAAYKLSILEQADACTQFGAIGALLRREGLYSAHLSKWRKQRRAGRLQSFAHNKTDAHATDDKATIKENKDLKKEVQRLREQLRQAELIIDVQKKLSELLGLNGTSPSSKDSS